VVLLVLYVGNLAYTLVTHRDVFGSPLDLFEIATTAFIVRAIAADGETTWFEGLLLVGVYILFALAYYFESPT